MAKPLRDGLRDHVRLYDQMCSMHSLLRDRYGRRAKVLDVALLIAAGGLAAVTFLGSDITTPLGISALTVRLVFGGASTAVFIVSLVASRVDWKSAAERHARAAITLVDLKARARSLSSTDGMCSDEEIQDFLRQGAILVGTLPEIPEPLFLPLKAAHLRKVAISRLLDRGYGAPVWWLRLRLGVRHAKKVTGLLNEPE